jgi:pimeloyl-ACP methyl ester carboxylesterase
MRRGNATPFYIIGESFGGTVALHLSLRLSEEQSGAGTGGVGNQRYSPAYQAYPGYRGTFFIAPALQAVMPPKIVVWTLRYGLAPFFPKWIPPFMPDNLAVENIWEDQSVAHWYKTKDELGDPEGKLRLGTALQVRYYVLLS